MQPEEIHQRLTTVFRDIFDREDLVITRQTSAPNIEDWDSLANISLVVAVEKEFKITFTLNEIKALNDVGAMLDLIKSKLS